MFLRMSKAESTSLVSQRKQEWIEVKFSERFFPSGNVHFVDDNPGEFPPSVDPPIRDKPDENGKIDATEVAGLKSALERLKAENSSLKSKATVADRLLSDGVSPDELPAILESYKTQQERDRKSAQERADMEAKAAASERKLREEYEESIAYYSSALQERGRDSLLTDIFIQGGGSTKNEVDLEQFRTLVAKYIDIEYEPVKKPGTEKIIDYRPKVTQLRSPKGDEFRVDDNVKIGKSRLGTVEDFLLEIKQGKYGTGLQYLLPAYNQAHGAGVSLTPGADGGPYVIRSGAVGDLGRMTNAQLADMKKKGVRVVE